MKISAINPSQVFILQALAKADKVGMTKAQIEKKTGVSASTNNLGPVNLNGNLCNSDEYKDSLRCLGYLKIQLEETESGSVARYYITSKGLKVAEACVAKPRLKDENKIPHEKLDKAVLAIRPTRIYSLEDYTDADLKEIRSSIGGEWDHVSLGDLRQQIVNNGIFQSG